jgi:uncharacterized protein DUF4157
MLAIEQSAAEKQRARRVTAAPLPAAPVLQRKCACGGTATSTDTECEQCKKKKLQRRAKNNSELEDVPEIVEEVLNAPGRPLDADARSFMEPRFGHDFSRVRVHTDARAAASARSVNALAYTVGSNVVFAQGQYAPGKSHGRKLLAHELAHVVQQRRMNNAAPQAKLEIGPANDELEKEADKIAEHVAGVSGTAAIPPPKPPSAIGHRLQRAVEDSTPGETATAPPESSPIVDDEAQQIGPGQMRKTEFLDALRTHVCSVADAALASAGRTAQGCPMIERWIGRLRARNVQYIERGIRRYATPPAQASAQDYITAVGEKVREGVTRWTTTGDVSGVPPELMSEMAGGGILGALSSFVAGIGTAFGFGSLLAKGKEGGAKQANPSIIRAQLNRQGLGRPLESGVQSRMEAAFGHSFSHVRVHDDVAAAQLSSSLNARAFTVGDHVTFAAGEYAPGTLIGDALIAHELAHVVQQQESPRRPEGDLPDDYAQLEEDADRSAVEAILSLFGRANVSAKTAINRAMPRLRSGLRLQRCGPSLRNPQEVQQQFTAAQNQIIAGIGTGQTADDVGQTLQQLQSIFSDQIQDAGANTRAQAQAQQDFLDQVERLRTSYRKLLEMSQRYHVRFTSEQHQIEFQASPPRRRYHIRTWSQDDLQKIDEILRRAPAGSLANIQKINREPGTDSSVPAAWEQSPRTLFVYDLFFERSGDERAQFLLHEIGHSADALATVGTFRSLPNPMWMQLSDWRTSTAATFALDLNLSGAQAREAMQRVDSAQRPEQSFPRPIQIGQRMVVVDRYGSATGPNQYLHYAVSHNQEFVTDYARSHPADDLAESYAKYVLEPEETRRKLDVGPRGASNKWRYLRALLDVNAQLAAQPPAPASTGSSPATQGTVQPKLRDGQSSDPREQEADQAAEQVTGSRQWAAREAMSLTHSPLSVQRASAPAANDQPAPTVPRPAPVAATSQPALIVEDTVTQPSSAQMRKSEFLDALRMDVCEAADAVLRTTGRTAEGCPVIEQWIARLRARNSQYIERGIRRYAASAARATSARDYLPAVAERVRLGVQHWAATGDLSQVPPELMSEMAGGGIAGVLGGIASVIGGAISGAVSAIGGLFRKSRDESTVHAEPVAVKSQLGAGTSLESGVQARMERAFGYSFGRVRVHADGLADELSSGMNARAFTVGHDVAFAAGEYQPGTLVGDALIAHELAHVVQQGQAKSAPSETSAIHPRSLEEDADHSGVGAMIALRAGGLGALKAIGAQAAPRMRSGLRLQRCSHSRPAATTAAPRTPAAPPTLATLQSTTAWQLAQLPQFTPAATTAASAGGPAMQDYARANVFIRALFSRYHITFDVDREQRILGHEPTPQQLQIMNRLMGQALAVPGVSQAVSSPGARGVPAAPGSSSPSLQGHARVLNDGTEYSIKRYQLQWLVAGLPDKPLAELERDVRSEWQEIGTQPAANAVITEQERRAVALIASVSHMGIEPGFYFPPDDIFYLAPNADLSDPRVQNTARHETMHLLGGRERTRQAFVQRFGTPHYIRYWSPFEEGMAELINMEATRATSAPVCAPGLPPTESAYGGNITLMCRLIGQPGMGRDVVFQAYFTGNIPDSIFQFLVQNAPAD